MSLSQTPLVSLAAGMPAAGVSGRFDWPDGKGPTFLLHSDFDLFWVTRGRMRVEMKGGPDFELEADEFFLKPPFIAVTVSQVDPDKPRRRADIPRLSFMYCHFDFRPHGEGRSGQTAMRVPLKFSAGEAPAVRRAYHALARMDVTPPLGAWRKEAALIDLVTALAEFAMTRKPRRGEHLLRAGGHDDPRVGRLCERIMADPVHPWQVSDLARSAGLSTSRLHAIFRPAVGMSLKSYIVRTRLRHALRLLRDRSGGQTPSVKEVAAACGFSSQHFFARQFKKLFHQTPTAFRDGGML